jgi:type III secretion protein N (ATPase)
MNFDIRHIERGLDGFCDLGSYGQQIGRILEVTGNIVRSTCLEVRIGELCLLREPSQKAFLTAEVVGLAPNSVLLTPLGSTDGISTSTEIVSTGRQAMVPVGDALIGRILDGLGHPLDEEQKGPLSFDTFYPMSADPPPALKRKIIDKPFSLGIRSIDGLLTCCEGQRVGIFAGAGYGKSSLLAMIARSAEADVIVLALIGERGREVREFIEKTLTATGMEKSIVVVATSDCPAMERIKAAYAATTIAEYFRLQGKKVLLMVDSITRFARAQRELGLALGEPPTRRGYPPSLFSKLPQLIERAGQSESGSITAIYTVLVEGDDLNEPVADEMRSLLDGHIVLSSKLVKANHYPAIDVLASVSRVMKNVVSAKHRDAADRMRTILAKYQDIELLVKLGEYKTGSDKASDEAIEKIGAIHSFLIQNMDEKEAFDATLQKLIELTES